MKKSTADKIALVMVRDILRVNSEKYRTINAFLAEDIAAFVKTLSDSLQKNMDDSVKASEIINAYKGQPLK